MDHLYVLHKACAVSERKEIFSRVTAAEKGTRKKNIKNA